MTSLQRQPHSCPFYLNFNYHQCFLNQSPTPESILCYSIEKMTEITSPSLTATLCDHEHRAWSALCTSGSALLPLLSSNPVMIFPGGMILTATSTPSLQESLKEGNFTPWESYTLSHDETVPVS
jgi:hypothetical protein